MPIAYRCTCGHWSWSHLFLEHPGVPTTWPCRGADRATGQSCPCRDLDPAERVLVP